MLRDRLPIFTEDQGGVRAKNIELFSRDIKVYEYSSSKRYIRDKDDLYPVRIDKIINNSPTAKRCANLMAKYIAGKGNSDNYIINRKKGTTINDIIYSSAVSISKQYGVFFKLRFGLDITSSTSLDNKEPFFKISDIEVMDYSSISRSKKDDSDNQGKFFKVFYNEDDSIDEQKTNDRWFYPFNLNNKVIKEQMLNDCIVNGISNPTMEDLITNHRGQIYYLNLTPEYVYALPLVDAVYNDCDTEYRISLYNNTQTRDGFLGKVVVVKYDTDVEKEEEFELDLKGFLGTENASNMLLLRMKYSPDIDLEKSFVVKQLKPQFDDKLFEKTVYNIRQNILGAFNNIPEALVFAGSGALFGTSGDSYGRMKQFYWEQNDYERRVLEQTLKMFGFEVSIMPLIENVIEN